MAAKKKTVPEPTVGFTVDGHAVDMEPLELAPEPDLEPFVAPASEVDPAVPVLRGLKPQRGRLISREDLEQAGVPESLVGLMIDPDPSELMANSNLVMPAEDIPFMTAEMRELAGATEYPAQVGYVDSGLEVRAAMLDEVAEIVLADRNIAYGPPEDSFGLIAGFWSTYLNIPLLPHDVAAMMVLMKVARIQTNPGGHDSWADVAGYGICGGSLPEPDMT